MFCCNRGSQKYDPLDTKVNKNMMKSSHLGYPGSRRPTTYISREASSRDGKQMIQTGGNALMEYDPETMSDVMKIVVPVDSVPGQLIQITAPDGSGRVANVIIPLHCKPGTSFLMKFPTVEETELLNDLKLQQENTDIVQGGNNNSNGGAVAGKTNDGGDMSMTSTSNNNINNNMNAPTDLLDDTDQQQNPLEQRLLQDYDQRNTTSNANSNANANIHALDVQNLIIVSVPPGVSAGTTIYAQIPSFFATQEQKRYVPVTVPKGGVSQFYTCYMYGHTLNEMQVMAVEQERVAKQSGHEQKQNWHDNSVAYTAPMVAYPFLV